MPHPPHPPAEKLYHYCPSNFQMSVQYSLQACHHTFPVTHIYSEASETLCIISQTFKVLICFLQYTSQLLKRQNMIT